MNTLKEYVLMNLVINPSYNIGNYKLHCQYKLCAIGNIYYLTHDYSSTGL